MANDDLEDNETGEQGVNFLDSMQTLLHMNKEQVDDLLSTLNSEELQSLTDAVAKHDANSAKQVISQAQTDEDVNALFRGKNMDSGERQFKPRPSGDKTQFAIGDDVMVNMTGKDGEVHPVTATVANPDGPGDTVVVKIKGKTHVVKKGRDKNGNERISPVSESIEECQGLDGMGALGRLQQLAGMRAQRLDTPGIGMGMPELDIEADNDLLPDNDPPPDDPVANAMSAFDTLEACLPNIQLMDLKSIRDRLMALQQSLNENLRYGRQRKV